MSLTLTQMRALVRKGLGGLTSDQLPDADVDLLLNLSLWELTDKYPFKEKECRVWMETVAGTDKYDLPNDKDAIQSVAIQQDNDLEQYQKLGRMTVDWYDAKAHPDNTDHRGQPERYLRRDDFIVLWPIPDQVYRVWLTYWRTIPTLLSGTVDLTGLPRAWDEIVVEGAITRGHYYNEDYPQARQADNFRINHIRSIPSVESKEERDSRYAGLEVLWERPYDR